MFKAFLFRININNPDKDYFSNIRLETFIFHARNLIEFYYSGDTNKKEKKKYEDDAWAVDFFIDKNTWYNLRPNIDAWKEKFFKRAGKEMAHLTYSRLDLNDVQKRWDVYEIVKPLKEATILFIDNIDEKYKTPRIKEFLEYMHNLIF